jgi:hypothetical protein
MRAVRKARRWVVVVATVVAVAAGAGCAAPVPGTAVAAPSTSRGDHTATGRGEVLSPDTADSAGTVDSTTLQGRLIAGKSTAPPGFRSVSVIVDRGLGSFTVALPAGFRSVWWPGMPSEDFVAQVAQRDPAWGSQARRIVTADPPPVRALALDTTRTGQVAMVVITAGGAPTRADAASLVAAAHAEITRIGGRERDVHPVVANGVDGVFVEFEQPARSGRVPDRTNLSVRITDPHNDVQWGVTCDLPDALRDSLRDQCLQVAGAFRPLPAVSG